MNHHKQPGPADRKELLERKAIEEPPQAATFEDSAPAKTGSRTGWVSRALTFLLLISLVGVGIWLLVDRFPTTSSANADVPVSTVKRINLRDTIIERGTLSSQQSIEINCEMDRWENKIISILPEGTVVKKGRVVLRFDSSRLEENITEYQQYVAEFRSALQLSLIHI